MELKVVILTNDDFLNESIIKTLKFKNENDKVVFNRVYGKPLTIYKNRLEILKMKNKKKILDAGCGFGQWAVGLSDLNESVYSIDLDFNDLKIAKTIFKNLGKNNISLSSTSIEELPFLDNSFDAVFSYSVLYYTDFKKTVKEFYRVLKPGGTLYSSVIGLGWCLNRILTNENFTSENNVRNFAINTLLSSINYFFTGQQRKGRSIALTQNWFNKYLKSIGFKNIISAPEGNINLDKNLKTQSFYKPKYMNLSNVFEILAEK